MLAESRFAVADSSPPVKPILRWAGSKRKLLPKLAPYWSGKSERYLEPFAGSSAFFFSLQPGSAVLSDTNRDLIEVLRAVRDFPEEISDRFLRMRKSKAAYYKIRTQDKKSLTKLDRVARFIYLNRFCFNGLYRTNMDGDFNVPYAPSGTGDLPTLSHLQSNANLLKKAKLRVGDFEKVIRSEVCAGDFVYLDPPYAVKNRRIFSQYGPHTFGLDDLERLGRLLTYIHSQKAAFLLSYADCKEARALASRWSHRRVYAQRNIAGFHLHRRRAAEMLISNIGNGGW